MDHLNGQQQAGVRLADRAPKTVPLQGVGAAVQRLRDCCSVSRGRVWVAVRAEARGAASGKQHIAVM